MIEFFFYSTKKKELKGFLVRGHANYSEKGSDIVCAGVSAIVEMCCNGICEVLKRDVIIECEEGKIFLEIKEEDEMAKAFLRALELEVSLLQQQYKENISLKIMEEK